MNLTNIEDLNKLASTLSEVELDTWIVNAVLDIYQAKIDKLAYWVYADNINGISNVARLAFRERAKTELRSGLVNFLFKFQYWKEDRSISPYLLACLNRLAQKIKFEISSGKKTNIPICPVCKFYNKKEYLIPDGKNWRCEPCFAELSNLESEKNSDLTIQSKLKLLKTFAVHSRSGFRCSDCKRFIPDSSKTQYGISCPYPDCDFFGSPEELEKMTHPVGLSNRSDLSLNELVAGENDTGGIQFQDILEADTIDPDVELEMAQNIKNEVAVLKEVLSSQKDSILRINGPSTMLQKITMYDAFTSMLKTQPSDMVAYLVHRKQCADFPIQARIFQEYASLIQNALPVSVEENGETHNIVSLLDPNLQLFTGISVFEAAVSQDNIIPNNTIEMYTGGRKFKCYGPCFIGLIIDVIDKNTQKSIKNMVEYYSFSQIKMKPGVKIGTSVIVKHFRISSHYEMGSLVFLQRIRKKIVDAVYYKLHGEKRKPRA